MPDTSSDRRPGSGRAVRRSVRRSVRRAALLMAVAATAVTGLTVAAPARAAAPAAAPAKAAAAPVHRSCATAPAGRARCYSRWQRTAATVASVRDAGRAAVPLPPASAIGAKDVAAAYQLPAGGAATTVAIVDAFDNPNAEQDLAVYRAAFGLSPCTTANGCFRKVNQRGGATPPDPDAGWGVEIALDVQAASAACPTCKILLVEADDNSFDNLGKSVNTAVRLGAKVVSNSYGGDEFNGVIALGKQYYTHPGVAQVSSSGDFGFTAASAPAVYSQLIAAGGTTLTRTPAGYTERAWEGAGSGCSAWIPKPAWQKDTHCLMRTTSDVSAVADNFAVYDTFGLGPDNGWISVGGTSVSSPLIAAMIGRAGNAARLDSARFIYTHRAGLHDVIGGSNGFCGGDYLCVAKKGYDGPTGLGSPRGLGAL